MSGTQRTQSATRNSRNVPNVPDYAERARAEGRRRTDLRPQRDSPPKPSRLPRVGDSDVRLSQVTNTTDAPLTGHANWNGMAIFPASWFRFCPVFWPPLN